MTIRAIISRAEAKAQGLKRYFTGIPCKRGHVDERQVSWGRCAACNRENVARKGATPVGQVDQLKRSLKWRASDKGRKSKRESDAKQYRTRPDAYKARARLKRARKRGAEGYYDNADLHAIMEQQGLSCYCGVSFLVVKPTIDHVVPLARGGSNWPDNIQFLCAPCNDSKGIRLMSEWIDRRAA